MKPWYQLSSQSENVGRKPLVMGIVNVTPDSFSDGGKYYQSGNLNLDIALAESERMVSEGADILDIGGESTRPGAEPVALQEELERVVPLVEKIAAELDVKISVDTSSALVMTEAAAAGAHLINDVRALQREGALEAAVQTGLPVCLMHMQGAPTSMQDKPKYRNVVAEVSNFLSQCVAECVQAGIEKEKIWVDPGFGFGKTLEHNLELFRGLPQLAKEGCPVLVGVSRKSMIGHLLNREVDQRLAASLAFAMSAAQKGAAVLRVHDVAETVDVLKVLNAVESPSI